MMKNKPNLVFIHNDHQAFYQWQDCAVKPARPNFERVARQGIEFENAYCATPLCAPTRRSLLTGVYPHTHKSFYNVVQVPYGEASYLELLNSAGYDNYYFGKWHAGPGDAGDQRCKGVSITGYGNPYVQQDYKDYLKENGLTEATIRISHALGWEEWRYGKPDSPFSNLAEGYGDYRHHNPGTCGEHAAGILLTPKETHESFYLASRACEALRDITARKDNAMPFSLRVDFWGPHHPYFPTQEYLDMYKDIEFPEYPSWNSKLDGKPDCYHRERNSPIGKNNRLIIPNARPWSFYQDLMRHCAAQITMMDAAAGMILDQLEQSGLMDNTMIIFTTDHGDALACHGGHFDKASYMPQEVLRIPMAIRWDGYIRPGQKTNAPVSSVSVPVTLLDAAGLEFPHQVQAKSLLGLASGQDEHWPDYVVAESHGHGFGEEVASRVIVREQFKYVSYFDNINIDELYDLSKDKYEMHNIADDEQYSSIKDSLRRQLLEWQKDTGDTLKFSWAG